MAALMTGAEPEKWAVEQSESPAPGGEAAAVVQNPNYEITVTSAEALILARPMSQAGITPERTVQENGDVTFSVAEAEKDTLERLITKIRNDISKAAAAVSRPKKARRTRPEINYCTFAKGTGETAPLDLQQCEPDHPPMQRDTQPLCPGCGGFAAGL